MQLKTSLSPKFNQRQADGFTLLEVLIVVFIIGILAAIGIPSWLNLVNTTRLNTAQDKIFSALLQAKSKAKQEKRKYRVSFRDTNEVAQWVIHPASIAPTDNSNWENLDPSVQIDERYTTFYQTPATGFWRAQFNDKGHASLGRITVSLRNGNSNQVRCVFISTILGVMREEDDCD